MQVIIACQGDMWAVQDVTDRQTATFFLHLAYIGNEREVNIRSFLLRRCDCTISGAVKCPCRSNQRIY